MNNAKKIFEKKEPKAPKVERTRRVKVDITTLPDAIVDGKLIVSDKSRVYFERLLDGKVKVHEGYVFSRDDTTGSVSIWDETRGQFYGFSTRTRELMFKSAS